MMAQAAIPLGITVRLLATAPDDSAAQVCPSVIIGSPDSPKGLDALAATSDVITFDHELVDVPQLQRLEAAGYELHPSSATVAIAQDKLQQREAFSAAGLPGPAWEPVPDLDALLCFAERHGWPVVAKAARGGYDGRGVWVLDGEGAAQELVERAQAAGVPLLAESWVPIEREIAALVARSASGEMVVYPVVETVQRDGICHEVLAPAPISPSLTEESRRLALAVAEVVGVTGILAVEMFASGGSVLINEIATRPHNSGHFSIEGSVTSQFENHLRAVLDWPLGRTDLTAPAVVMANVLAGPETGSLTDALPAALSIPGVHVHLYGKAPRPGRKVGHVTALGDDMGDARERANRAAAILAGRTVKAT
jgi:phosphoribosylaminoimidazole carboxylase PurK protein